MGSNPVKAAKVFSLTTFLLHGLEFYMLMVSLHILFIRLSCFAAYFC